MSHLFWTQLWQLTLLITLAAVVSRWQGRGRPHLSHALWLVVLAKCVTPPVWSSPQGIFSWLQSAAPTEAEVAEIDEEPLVETVAMPAPPMDWNATHPVSAAELPPVDDVDPAMFAVAEDSTAISAPPVSNPPSFPIWLTVWGAGTGVILLGTGIRWRLTRRRILATAIRHDPRLDALLTQLSAHLRVRRPVRLLVTMSDIGPAVVGVFRPTILLPARLLHGRSPADWEPILAHELVHVRRGDLWVGWWQILAQAVWWFHPLVWWANRMMTRDAERCCDEEVVAELGCEPARYARSLVHVLEMKQILKPVPAFPGVKPVEITTQRLERIMLLGQGCRRRSPWWCWMVMLLTAAVALPGAAMTASAKNKKSRQKPPAQAGEEVTRKYKVQDVLAAYQRDFGVSPEVARKYLLVDLKRMCGGDSWKLTAKKLIATQTQEGHQTITDHLDNVRKNGLQQLVIETRIVQTPPRWKFPALFTWKALPAEVPSDQLETMLGKVPYVSRLFKPKHTHGLVPSRDAGNGVSTTIEKHAPLKYTVLTSERVKEYWKKLADHPQSNILIAPKVVTFNGRSASVQSLTQRPFVVGFDDSGKPKLRLVNDGIEIELRPVLREGEVRLESVVRLSEVRSVSTAEYAGRNGEKIQKVQIPEVATTQIRANVNIPLEGTLLISGLERQEDGKSLPIQIGVRVAKHVPIPKAQVLLPQPLPAGIDPPTADEVMAALAKQHNDNKLFVSRQRNNVRIVAEKVKESVGEVKNFPQVGPAKLHTTVFRCTVHFDETLTSTWPIPHTVSDQKKQVVFIEKSRLLRGGAPKPWKPAGKAESPYRPVPLPNSKSQNTVKPAGGTRTGRVLFGAGVSSHTGVSGSIVINDEEEEIRRSLAKSISLQFEEESLKKVVAHIAKTAGLNIVLDMRGIDDAATAVDAKISMKAKDITVRQLLEDILEPLDLAFIVEDEVVKITSKDRAFGPLEVRTYPVADLVIPIPGAGQVDLTNLEAKRANPPTKMAKPKADFSQLIELLQTQVEPESWQQRGGEGSMSEFQTTLSLVVRARRSVHKKLVVLLTTLRKLQDVQVTLEMRVIDLKDTPKQARTRQLFTKTPKQLSAKDVRELLTAVASDAHCAVTSTPKMTVFNGQPASVKWGPKKLGSTWELLIAATASSDRRGISLRTAMNPKSALDALSNSQRTSLKSGNSLLIPTDDTPQKVAGIKLPPELAQELAKPVEGKRQFLLITPRVIVVEEEEELLGNPN